ncbi:flavin reductase family protein [bacterium]|nr:flavin reductase family protein [bacterium]
MADEKDIKKVLRKLEYGIYVMSMGKGADGNAFTASWVMQVSSEPPMVAAAVHNKHKSAWQLNDLDAYVINILPESGLATAKTYYGPAESGYDKLQAKDISATTVTGTPRLNGAIGYLDCKIVERVKAGNHTVFVAEVVGGELSHDGPILTTSGSKLHYAG